MAFDGSTSTSVKNVGTYTLGAGDLALSSTGNNYALNFSNPSSRSYVITAKTLTVIGLTANNKPADGFTTATLSGTASLQTAESAGSGSTSDGIPYSVDIVSVTGTPTGTFTTSAAGTGISVNVTGLFLTGGQSGNYSLAALTLSADITAGPWTTMP